jgi:hypothetical protein
MQTIIHNVKRESGIAGQFAVTADVEHPGEERSKVTFVGSVYGGPVVMRSSGVETFVTDPSRFGEFGTDWVRRFFGQS